MSPLQTLAPDQRAVLELLLRQGRSYAQLSELLGLPGDVVRSRAHLALAALAPDRAAPVAEDGAVADWILGQQDPDEASSTRAAIARMPAWRAWAAEVTDRLAEVDGAKVPDVPEPDEGDAAPAAELTSPAAAAAQGRAKNTSKPRSAPGVKRGSRPRPLRDAAAAETPRGAVNATGEQPSRVDRQAVRGRDNAGGRGAPGVASAAGAAAGLRSSKLGGAVLIGVLVLLIGGFLVWFLGRGDDNNPSTPVAASATPTATPQVVVEVPLKGVGDQAAGLMRVFKRDDGKLVFALAADKMPANKPREVYAVWFTKKGGAPRNLGFAQAQVGKNGVFTTGGPQQGQEVAFAQWLTRYDTVVVARASANAAASKQPGRVVLRGTLPGGR
jgi:hypothetical protein